MEYQKELQGETGILILYDMREKHGWKEDKKRQLKQKSGTQVENTTNKISVIEISVILWCW
jgi:hypothetical protein